VRRLGFGASSYLPLHLADALASCSLTDSGRVRYHYTHEILPGAQKFRGEVPVDRTHRVSIMMRDVFLPEHLDKYGVPQPDVNSVDDNNGKRY
jgi:hypothetical protein